MQVTSPMQPIPVLDDVVEAPGRHRRNRHEPRMCAVCAAPLAGQAGACWRCGTGVPEPVRHASAPLRYRTAPAAATNVLRPDFAADRWANEGGTIDRETAVAVRGYSQLVGSDGLVAAG
jgi:hypothetical protein